MKFQLPVGNEDYPGIAYYLNLSNGIEAIEHWFFSGLNFVRMQSTWMEQKQTDAFISDIDYDFLMHLALGYRIVLYDFTKRGRKKMSRAMWQGVKWLEYVLNRIWFGKETEFEQGMHVFFQEEFEKLSRKTKKKIKYFRKFLKTDHLDIDIICDLTEHDGDYCYFSKLLDKWLEGSISYE